MKKVNPKHIAALLKLINSGPYFELLSMKVTELKMGYSRVEVDLERKHLNPFGAIHGGVYSSVIDTAAYWAAYCELEENTGFTSIDVKVDNVSMMREGRIIVEGKSLKIGRQICLAEAGAYDKDGRLLAHGTSKLMIMQGIQSVTHAVEAMGFSALPPKFFD